MRRKKRSVMCTRKISRFNYVDFVFKARFILLECCLIEGDIYILLTTRYFALYKVLLAKCSQQSIFHRTNHNDFTFNTLYNVLT